MLAESIAAPVIEAEPCADWAARMRRVELSIIVPVAERHDDLEGIYRDFSQAIEEHTRSFEFIFALDGKFRRLYGDLKRLKEEDDRIRILSFNSIFGESALLSVAFRKARGSYLFTLPAYRQVEPYEFSQLYEALKGGADLVVAARHPRRDPLPNRIQAAVFNRVAAGATGVRFHDIACGVRGLSHRTAEEINLYGDMHRFLPALAVRQGLRVREVTVNQDGRDTGCRVYGIGIYVRRLLDLLTLFFLLKFTRKPLRFFGFAGSAILAAGAAISLYLGVIRLIFGEPISNRPLLLLGVLLITIGLQIVFLGLIGELITFTHARDMNDYHIDEILE